MYNDLCIDCITAIKIIYWLDQTELHNLPIFRIPPVCQELIIYVSVYDDAVIATVYDTPTTLIMYKCNEADHSLA